MSASDPVAASRHTTRAIGPNGRTVYFDDLVSDGDVGRARDLEATMSGNAATRQEFGVCLDCGGPVERVGWDDLCFACQESEHAELDPYEDEE